MCEVESDAIARGYVHFPSFQCLIGICLRVVGRENFSIHGGCISIGQEKAANDDAPVKEENQHWQPPSSKSLGGKSCISLLQHPSMAAPLMLQDGEGLLLSIKRTLLALLNIKRIPEQCGGM